MNTEEALQQINKTESNEAQIDFESLSNELFPEVYVDPWDLERENQKLKSFWLAKRMCTDTYVGTSILYFDDQPFGVARIDCRKCDYFYDFFDESVTKKAKEYLFSLMSQEDELVINKDVLKIEIGEAFEVSYSSEILSDYVILKETGEYVKVVKSSLHSREISDYKKLKVTNRDGEKIDLTTQDILIPYELDPATAFLDRMFHNFFAKEENIEIMCSENPLIYFKESLGLDSPLVSEEIKSELIEVIKNRSQFDVSFHDTSKPKLLLEYSLKNGTASLFLGIELPRINVKGSDIFAWDEKYYPNYLDERLSAMDKVEMQSRLEEALEPNEPSIGLM